VEDYEDALIGAYGWGISGGRRGASLMGILLMLLMLQVGQI
jgi:hypothetical protein